MKTVQFAVAAVGAAALMCMGGAESAEAHKTEPPYYANIIVDILEYEVDNRYSDFDLVRMKIQIENLDYKITRPIFSLGSDSDSVTHVQYADVRGKGGDVSVDDCISNGRFDSIAVGSTGQTDACFMIPKQFEPEALQIFFTSAKLDTVHSYNPDRKPDACDTSSFGHSAHVCGAALQIIPFHDESVYCFVNNGAFCNKNNIQPIDGMPVPQPEPEPEPLAPESEPATLLHTIYHNQTGILILVFDQLVVASNPDRIHLIHDIDAFIEDGTAPDLGNAELNTVDNKRQSAVLAFKLSDVMRLEVMESLRTHGDLALLIDTRAVYAAEGFMDITRPDNSPLLVLDIIVVR